MSDIKTFSLTFGDVAENHKGMQKIGTLSNNGFNLDDINKMKIWFESKGCKCTIINLHWLLEDEKLVDIVAGPDSYRDLPNLISTVGNGQKAVNVLLSREETYADISPIRLDKGGVCSYVSIMRGCDNMCSFCVVPFTRGRERSRDPLTILQECKDLFSAGYREVTLLGQNVDSYRWNLSSKGEIKDDKLPTTNFAQLLELVSTVSPDLRVRFSTSHPKDMTDEVLETIAKHENICPYIHLYLLFHL